MSFELSGKIKVIFDQQNFQSGFYKREFVVTTQGEYPQDIKFELLKDKVAMLEPFSEGADVKVMFDVRGNEYNGKYYNNLVAWRIEGETDASSQEPPQEDFNQDRGVDDINADINSASSETDDDLPF
jgi:hypothetical protein